MELKFVILVRRDITMTGSNRTFMELKYRQLALVLKRKTEF